MKRIIILGVSCALTFSILSPDQALAQSAQMAVELASLQSPNGSARYQALSGAMGAMGADFSSVHANPAGIALFRSGSRVSLTGALHTGSTTGSWGTSESKRGTSSAFRFDDLSFMSSWATSSGRTMTIGFGIQNNGRVLRSLDAATSLTASGGFSVADYTEALLNLQRNVPLPSALTSANPWSSSGAPWLGILGYNSYWLDYHAADKAYQSGYSFVEGGQDLVEGPRSSSLMTEEDGSVTNYDFALGMQASSIAYFGFGLTASTLEYSYRSWYTEGFRARPTYDDYYGLSLDNAYRLSGVGLRLSLGLILEPIDGLRLGASIYTPTMYSMTLDLSPTVATVVSPALTRAVDAGTIDLTKVNPKNPIQTITPSSSANAFGLHTPWRFGLSAAYVMGRKGIISADYEYSDLGGTRLRTTTADDGYYQESDLYDADNELISRQYGGRHQLRFGLEYNVTSRLALRGGYRYHSASELVSGLSGSVPSEEVAVAGTAVHYRLPGAVNALSLGFGYRFSPSWTLDVAYVHARQTDRVQAFPYIEDPITKDSVKPAEAIKDVQRCNTFAATISYRF